MFNYLLRYLIFFSKPPFFHTLSDIFHTLSLWRICGLLAAEDEGADGLLWCVCGLHAADEAGAPCRCGFPLWLRVKCKLLPKTANSGQNQSAICHSLCVCLVYLIHLSVFVSVHTWMLLTRFIKWDHLYTFTKAKKKFYLLRRQHQRQLCTSRTWIIYQRGRCTKMIVLPYAEGAWYQWLFGQHGYQILN